MWAHSPNMQNESVPKLRIRGKNQYLVSEVEAVEAQAMLNPGQIRRAKRRGTQRLVSHLLATNLRLPTTLSPWGCAGYTTGPFEFYARV
jgi:hypothetical protein